MHVVSKPPTETAPPRMAPLSLLPLFADLAGKSAVVAGGSDAAAWKAELLVAAGAEVHLFAPQADCEEEMLRLLAREGGRIQHHDRPWHTDCLKGVAIAVANAENEDEALAFANAAREAGAPCNVIDRPAFCTFQFGSIVNRSPVVIGISSSGVAPVLSQAVRRRVETLLPHWLSEWARLARDIRPRVMERLAPGRPRRAFWEGFVDRAFKSAPPAGAAERLVGEAGAIATDARLDTGHVTFVGAGPGEAELLTVKAVRALQAADVILFDDLVSDEVLELARREAKRILVGKRAGRPSCRQDEINDTMVRLARAGRRVVRLKSGDPMIFGRAGEEIARLEAEGIAFDVVPGVSAGVAMAALLGVSLTHRDHARCVRFVTGHSRHDGLPADLDWKSLADPASTTIFYMGGRAAGRIAERLMSLGLPGDTPVALAAAIGRQQEQTLRCTLGELGPRSMDLPRDLPVTIGIGKAFRKTTSPAERGKPGEAGSHTPEMRAASPNPA